MVKQVIISNCRTGKRITGPKRRINELWFLIVKFTWLNGLVREIIATPGLKLAIWLQLGNFANAKLGIGNLIDDIHVASASEFTDNTS